MTLRFRRRCLDHPQLEFSWDRSGRMIPDPRMATHDQKQCPRCHLWLLWVRKPRRRPATLAATLALLLLAAPARAQFIVHDPTNHVQIALTAETVIDELAKQIEKLKTITAMAKNKGDMSKYKTPPIAGVNHDIGRYPFANTLRGLNAGDREGELYGQDVRVLRPVAPALAAIPAVKAQLADLDLADAVNRRTIQLVANSRGFDTEKARAMKALEDDVLTERNAERYLTARLETLGGAALLDARQRSEGNNMLSTILEQMLSWAKPIRDMDAVSLNMRINSVEHGEEAANSIQNGATAVFRAWRP